MLPASWDLTTELRVWYRGGGGTLSPRGSCFACFCYLPPGKNKPEFSKHCGPLQMGPSWPQPGCCYVQEHGGHLWRCHSGKFGHQQRAGDRAHLESRVNEPALTSPAQRPGWHADSQPRPDLSPGLRETRTRNAAGAWLLRHAALPPTSQISVQLAFPAAVGLWTLRVSTQTAGRESRK